MDVLLLTAVTASLALGMLWVWYFYHQDRRQPEPLYLIAKAFLFGALAVFPAAVVELPIRGYLGQSGSMLQVLLVSFAGVGLIEEAAKYLAFRAALWEQPQLDEPVDGIIYAITAALGFATLENMFYTLSFGLVVIPVRAVTAFVAHASFSGIIGWGYAARRFADQQGAFATHFLAAAALHAFYNTLLVNRQAPFLALVIVAAAAFYLLGRIRFAVSKDVRH